MHEYTIEGVAPNTPKSSATTTIKGKPPTHYAS